MEGKLIKTEFGYQLFDADMRYITSLATKGLSLENCQTIELGYDLEALVLEKIQEIAKQHFLSLGTLANIGEGYILGFQKAIEILGNKRFDAQDIQLAYLSGYSDCLDKNISASVENYTQSLQPNEWDVEIAWETDEPILDKNGCYILKRK